MKFLLYGECNHLGSGAWCYAQTIQQMGYELYTYHNECSIEKFKSNFFLKILRRLNSRVIPAFLRKKHEKGLIELAKNIKPDIIIVLKGLHICASTVQILKQYSNFIININHDDFFSLNKNNWNNLQRKAIKNYDYIFVTRYQNVDEIKPFNQNVELLLFAYFPEMHKEYTLTPEEITKYSCDVLFVGTYEKQRAMMLEKLITNYHFDLNIYGNGWEKLDYNSPLKKYIKSYKGLWQAELAKAIKAAKISLGFLRKENRDEYTQRSFEIPACGGLLLAEDTGFHRKLFVENEHAVFFDALDFNALGEKINLLLQNDILRTKIQINGQKHVLSTHQTYADRILQVINKYEIFRR